MTDRLHWILLRGTLLLLSAGSAFAVPAIVWLALGNDSLDWEGDVGYAQGFPHRMVPTEPHVYATWDGHVTLSLDDASSQLRVAAALPDILLTLAVGFVAGVLLLVVLNVQEGRSFAGRAASGLRWSATVIAVAAVTVPLAHTWGNRLVVERALRHSDSAGSASPPGVTDALPTIIVWLLVSLLVLAVSRAFGEGSRLSRDVEGLV